MSWRGSMRNRYLPMSKEAGQMVFLFLGCKRAQIQELTLHLRMGYLTIPHTFCIRGWAISVCPTPLHLQKFPPIFVCLIDFFLFFFSFFKTRFLCGTDLAILEIDLQTRLSSNSLRSTYLCLPRAGVKACTTTTQHSESLNKISDLFLIRDSF